MKGVVEIIIFALFVIWLQGCAALETIGLAADVITPDTNPGIAVETEIVAGDKEVGRVGETGATEVEENHGTIATKTTVNGIPAHWVIIGSIAALFLFLVRDVIRGRRLEKQNTTIIRQAYAIGLNKERPND